jgi:hypothetical protein
MQALETNDITEIAIYCTGNKREISQYRIRKESMKVDPARNPNLMLMINYNGSFDSLGKYEELSNVKGQLLEINYIKCPDHELIDSLDIFQIILFNPDEERKIVISGSARAFIVQDFINRLCNVKQPKTDIVDLYFNKTDKGDKVYHNGRVRDSVSKKEIYPLINVIKLPKAPDERVKEYKHIVDNLNKKLKQGI